MMGLDFWTIIRAVMRWKFLVAGIVILGMVLASYLISQITPTYRATTTLEVRQQERNVIEVSNVENVIANREFLQTQVKLLRSDTLIRDVVEALNLTSDSTLVGRPEIYARLTREQQVRRAVNIVRSRLSVDEINKTRLIRLSFEHANPKKAAEIANAATSTFISNSLTRKYNSTQDARDFLEGRIEAVRRSLEEAERELVQYASDGAIVSTGDEGEKGNQSLDRRALIDVDRELTEAFIASSEAQSALDSWSGSDVSVEILRNPLINSLKQSRIDLQDEYTRQLSIFKPGHPDMVELQSRIDDVTRKIDEEVQTLLRSEKEQLERDLELAKSREALLSRKVEQLKKEVAETSVRRINLNILQRQVDSERSQYDALLQRFKEIAVSGQLGEGLVQVVDEAYPPQSPFKPRRLRLLAFALIFSLAVALSLVYFIETIIDKIRGPNDLMDKLKLNPLGVIPHMKGSEESVRQQITDPTSELAEAYASLRTNLQFSNNVPQIIQITSSRPSEGKSITSLALAVSFAALGEDVLLIDCDIRHPTFSRGKSRSKGLTGLLTSQERLEDHIVKEGKNLPQHLDLLPAGRKVDNPTEVLSRQSFGEMLNEARGLYKTIIIDSPPVLGLADAPIIGAQVDGTIFVTEAQRLQTPQILRSLERLRKSGTNIVGGLLTKLKAKSDTYYAYDYYGDYGYGKDTRRGGKALSILTSKSRRDGGGTRNKNKIDMIG